VKEIPLPALMVLMVMAVLVTPIAHAATIDFLSKIGRGLGQVPLAALSVFNRPAPRLHAAQERPQ
jgi:hypothetical protein